MHYKGDTGKFRRALFYAGFDANFTSIFNDYCKAKPKTSKRRLKLWWATSVFEAPQKQQRLLERLLRDAFGDRIDSMYFVQNSTVAGMIADCKSLCIKLKY